MNAKVIIFLFLYSVSCHAKSDKLCEDAAVQKRCTCGYNPTKSSFHYVVDCARTALKQVPDSAQLPSNIDELDLSWNEIKSLDNVKFKSNSLKVLNVRYNELTGVSKDFMKNVANLRRLDLSHNRIAALGNVFDGVPSLHQLDVSFNSLTNLPADIFLPLKTMKYLDLSYNNLGSQLMKSKSLYTSPLGISISLTSIKLAFTNITSLPDFYFGEYTNLTSMSLADNYLEEIPKLPEVLEYLDASGNYFDHLDVHQLNYARMKTLILNRLPRLARIDNYAFYNMQFLEVFSLEKCPKLKKLNDLAFGVLNEDEEFLMKRLSLAGNGFSKINQTYFKMFNKLQKINLSNNPWYCNCDVIWFKLISDKLINKDYIRCAFPRQLAGRKILLELTEIELPKCVVGSGWRTHRILITIISVLCLMLAFVVIFLIYMGPYSTKSTHYISTQSPYHSHVTTEDTIDEQR